MKKTSQIQNQTIKDVLTNKTEPSEMIFKLIENTFSYLQRVTADEGASTAQRLSAIKQQWTYSKWIEKHINQALAPEEDEESNYPILRLTSSDR